MAGISVLNGNPIVTPVRPNLYPRATDSADLHS